MIDIGANLASNSFSHDLDKVIARAKNVGIDSIIVTGSCFNSNDKAHELTKDYSDFLYATAGLHPHHASQWDDKIEKQISTLATQQEVVAIGETGLDYNRMFSPEQQQLHAFEKHLQLAESVEKPLFLHQRDAHNDFVAMLNQYSQLCERAVVHCFTDTKAALKAYLDLGCYIGITGWLCDKKRGAELREIVQYIPIDRLMIESDAPYLMPNRDKLKHEMADKHRNEPFTLPHVAQQLAISIGQTVETVRLATTANAQRFFKLC